MTNAMIPEAGETVEVTIPRAPKALVLESQIEAAEALADASMIAFSAKAEFGTGVTEEMVVELDKARTAFARSAVQNTASSSAKTVRPARRGRA